MSEENLRSLFSNLDKDAKPKWGILQAQHMVEHLEYQFLIAMEKIHVRLTTSPKHLDKFVEVVYNHQPMMKGFNHPMLKKGELENLRYDSLEIAIEKYFETRAEYESFFKENEGKTTMNPSFGELSKFEWDLLNRKHTHHHFEQFGLV